MPLQKKSAKLAYGYKSIRILTDKASDTKSKHAIIQFIKVFNTVG
jgi:hypothetical protein